MSPDFDGLFYAYAKHAADDWSYRYLITFASRDVADSWYRAITDSVKRGYTRFSGIERISPQFYTHIPVGGTITETINDSNVALSLRGKIFFTLINDKDARVQSMVPRIKMTDHINGASFYIRSVSQQDVYWHFDSNMGMIFASRGDRTRFTITITKTHTPGTLIVDSDEVFITTEAGTNIGFDANQKYLDKGIWPFEFSAFNNDFQIDSADGDTNGRDRPAGSGGTKGQDKLIAFVPGKGEKWELV